MALFRGQQYDDSNANHVFVCNHPGFAHAGLASFNLQTLASFAQNKILCDNLIASFRKFGLTTTYQRTIEVELSDGTKDTRTEIIDFSFFRVSPQFFLNNLVEILFLYDTTGKSIEGAGIDFKYDRWSNSSKTYIEFEKTVFDLYDDIIWYEEFCADPDSKGQGEIANIYEGNVFDIQRSRLGYASIKSENTDNYLVGDRCLNFYYSEKGKLNRTRTIAQKGVPFFSALARRPTGAPHLAGKTKENSTGWYTEAKDNPQDREPSDHAVGSLRVSWDANTQMFEVRNQIIAICLEDIDPAFVPPPDVNVENLDQRIDKDKRSSDFYDVGGAYYVGGFTTGRAMPVGLESGNPHLFGPNIKDCEEPTVEKIRLVNRANRSYKRGERVIAHFIDGEWVPTPIGEDLIEIEPPATAIGRWQFSQFIVSSAAHFRANLLSQDEAGFFNNIEGSNGTGVRRNVNILLHPKDWEGIMRYKFYKAHEKGKYGNHIVYRNEGTIEQKIKPPYIVEYGTTLGFNTMHIQHTSFDNIVGGKHYYRTNIRNNPLGDNEWPFHYNFPLFFGPVFSAGFRKLPAAQANSKYNPFAGGINPTYESEQFGAANNIERFPVFQPSDLNSSTSYIAPSGTSPMFSVLQYFSRQIDQVGDDDNNPYIANTPFHVPADIGINGPWGGTNAPLESFHVMARGMNNMDFEFIKTQGHLGYRLYTDGTNPYRHENGKETTARLPEGCDEEVENPDELDDDDEACRVMTAQEGLLRADGAFGEEEAALFKHWKDNHTFTNTLVPQSTNEVQFTSLTPTFAAMDEEIAQHNLVRYHRHYYSMVHEGIKPKFPNIGTSLGDALHRGYPQVGGYRGSEADDDRLPFSDGVAGLFGFTAYFGVAEMSSAAQNATGAEPGTPEFEEFYQEILAKHGETRQKGWITSPYDAYNNLAQGMNRTTNNAFGIWIEDGNNDGAELIGVITGRNKVSRSGGGNINIESKQLFGANSYSTAQTTSASASIIGGIMASITGATFKTNNARVAWGNVSNNPNDFGVTALHVKVYDYWPENQTVFIAPYFTVFHFNPGVLGSKVTRVTKYFEKEENGNINWNAEVTKEDYDGDDGDGKGGKRRFVSASVAMRESDVDHRPPQFYSVDVDLEQVGDDSGRYTMKKNDTLSLAFVDDNGDVQNFDNKLLRLVETNEGELSADISGIVQGIIAKNLPEQYGSKIDTSRRGKLLTGLPLLMLDGSTRTGYIHAEKFLGLSNYLMEFDRRGLGFVDDEEIDLGGGVKIIIKTRQKKDADGKVVGNEISDIKFAKEDIDGGANFIKPADGGVFDTENVMRGKFSTSDLNGKNGISYTFFPSSEGEDNERATITFKSLICYEVKSLDLGPREHTTGIWGVSLSTKGDGRGRVSDPITTSLSVQPNESGEYECFYYFHNDISHNVTENLMQNGGISITDFVQNITIKIS